MKISIKDSTPVYIDTSFELTWCDLTDTELSELTSMYTFTVYRIKTPYTTLVSKKNLYDMGTRFTDKNNNTVVIRGSVVSSCDKADISSCIKVNLAEMNKIRNQFTAEKLLFRDMSIEIDVTDCTTTIEELLLTHKKLTCKTGKNIAISINKDIKHFYRFVNKYTCKEPNVHNISYTAKDNLQRYLYACGYENVDKIRRNSKRVYCDLYYNYFTQKSLVLTDISFFTSLFKKYYYIADTYLRCIDDEFSKDCYEGKDINMNKYASIVDNTLCKYGLKFRVSRHGVLHESSRTYTLYALHINAGKCCCANIPANTFSTFTADFLMNFSMLLILLKYYSELHLNNIDIILDGLQLVPGISIIVKHEKLEMHICHGLNLDTHPCKEYEVSDTASSLQMCVTEKLKLLNSDIFSCENMILEDRNTSAKISIEPYVTSDGISKALVAGNTIIYVKDGKGNITTSKESLEIAKLYIS